LARLPSSPHRASGPVRETIRRGNAEQVNVGIGREPVEILVAFDVAEVHLGAGRPEIAADAGPVADQLFAIAAPDYYAGKVRHEARWWNEGTGSKGPVPPVPVQAGSESLGRSRGG